MTGVMRPDESAEARVVRVPERPIPFESFLEMPEDIEMELVGGVLVKRLAAQPEHEKLFGWLYAILRIYVTRRDLGVVLGSRTAVQTGPFGGRLPDVLFVRRERLDIVREKAVQGAPDLIVEIVSPNDRPSEIVELETEYRGLGVAEIWFIDRRRQRVRILRRRGDDNEETELPEGDLVSESVPGFRVRAEWLLREPRPKEHEVLAGLDA